MRNSLLPVHRKLLQAAALVLAVAGPGGRAADWKPEEENKTLTSLLRELGDAK